jgi:site-specific recombinase XerD
MNRRKPTDFAIALSNYFFEFLPVQKGLSKNTIQSYSDALSLFLRFCESEIKIKRENLEIKNLKRETVENYLNWLEREKNSSPATRNQRRIAMNTFFKYLQYENPGCVLLCQQILSIPKKVDRRQTIRYLSKQAIEEILKKPNLTNRKGRRDFAILSLMYEAAARVSEITDLRVSDLRFDKNGGVVRLLGKGGKSRIVPLINDVSVFFRKYIEEESRYRPHLSSDDPLFCNSSKDKLTRAGVAYILDKYAREVQQIKPDLINERVYPHILRHSRAMHWLEAGMDLQYIKDLLGHVDITTTEIYARLSIEMKRKMLENAYPVKRDIPDTSWTDDCGLMDWLQSFAPRA